MNGKCIICNLDKHGKNEIIYVSGVKIAYFICEDCESDKGDKYDEFFSNIRSNYVAEYIDTENNSETVEDNA